VTQHPETGEPAIRSTRLRADPLYVSLYVVWSKLILTDLLPYAAVVALNAVTVAKTVKAEKFRRRHGDRGGTILINMHVRERIINASFARAYINVHYSFAEEEGVHHGGCGRGRLDEEESGWRPGGGGRGRMSADD